MPRYALVEFSTMMVLNVGTVANINTVPASIGLRNIVENTTNAALNEWTPGDDPVAGDIWDGGIPAGFAPPVADPGIDPPVDQVQAFARISAARDALDVAIAQAAALVPTSL